MVVGGLWADSIMGVTFFSDAKPEHFAVFDRSLITMFRITSGEAWADYLPPLDEDGTVNFGTCIFFVSYTVIVCWTLLQVCLKFFLPIDEMDVKLQLEMVV